MEASGNASSSASVPPPAPQLILGGLSQPLLIMCAGGAVALAAARCGASVDFTHTHLSIFREWRGMCGSYGPLAVRRTQGSLRRVCARAAGHTPLCPPDPSEAGWADATLGAHEGVRRAAVAAGSFGCR